MNLLIVVARKQVEDQLQSILHSHRVQFAATAQDFLKCNPLLYDVVIAAPASLRLTIEQIISHTRTMPVVIIGDEADTEREIVAAIKAGASDYIHPRRLERVLPVIEQLEQDYSSQMLRALPEHLPVLLALLGRDGTILNAAGSGWAYLSTQNVATRNILEIMTDVPQFEQILAYAMTGEQFSEVVQIDYDYWEVFFVPRLDANHRLTGCLFMGLNIMRYVEMGSQSMIHLDNTVRRFPAAALVVETASGRIASMSDALMALSGRVRDETQHISDMIDLPDDYILQRPFHRMLMPLKHRDGQQQMVEFSGNPLDFWDGTYTFLIANPTKDTRLAERQLEALFAALTDVVLVVDQMQEHIITTNPAVELVLGFDPAHLTNRQFSVLLPPESRINVRYVVHELRIYGKLFEEQDFVHMDGSMIPMEITASSIIWNDTPALLIVLRDVTVRQAVHDALRQTEERLHLITNTVDLILFSLDKDGLFTFVEGHGLERLNVKPFEVQGQSIFDIFSDNPDILKDTRYALQGNAIHIMRDYGGRILEILYTPILTPHNQPNGLVGIAIDVTDREKMRQQKQQAEQIRIEMEKERELLKFREGFMSMISHEFRTPLTVILSSAQIMQKFKEKISEERRDEHLTRIIEQTKYMNKLMEDVLLTSRARTGRLEFRPHSLNLETLFFDILQATNLHEQKTHQATYDIGEDLSDVVMDAQLLHYIINNLLTNAFKYTPHGGRIQVSIRREDNTAVMVFQDSGIGIPERDQKLLFAPFHRAHNVGSIKGSGLGLALVRMCVETHGGEITFESEVGKGTTFYVRLPCG